MSMSCEAVLSFLFRHLVKKEDVIVDNFCDSIRDHRKLLSIFGIYYVLYKTKISNTYFDNMNKAKKNLNKKMNKLY
jgi:hypothetical protein